MNLSFSKFRVKCFQTFSEYILTFFKLFSFKLNEHLSEFRDTSQKMQNKYPILQSVCQILRIVSESSKAIHFRKWKIDSAPYGAFAEVIVAAAEGCQAGSRTAARSLASPAASRSVPTPARKPCSTVGTSPKATSSLPAYSFTMEFQPGA